MPKGLSGLKMAYRPYIPFGPWKYRVGTSGRRTRAAEWEGRAPMNLAEARGSPRMVKSDIIPLESEFSWGAVLELWISAPDPYAERPESRGPAWNHTEAKKIP